MSSIGPSSFDCGIALTDLTNPLLPMLSVPMGTGCGRHAWLALLPCTGTTVLTITVSPLRHCLWAQFKSFFISLFIASTGLVMSPVFLAMHLPILTAGLILVVISKTVVVRAVVGVVTFAPQHASKMLRVVKNSPPRPE